MNTKNRKEHIVGFINVVFLFAVITAICCVCLFYYSADNKSLSQKEFAIEKMGRMRKFQTVQNEKMTMIDSVYNKIKGFDPGVKASYDEDDIIYYINDIKNIYTENSYDGRYKVFLHISNFYYMWFYDRKELWTKQENITVFRKNLEACELGLEKRKAELNKK